ncbi:hypothetical protein KPH14_002864 [Odynerus spinipes]|uniref:Uncharacterized protein n=1 Tax=Odynerus spinipes TaxID=1348599 RepID=A0AAD9RWU3_9HYME|nr:hypothetical protein KPH14_002864 [Odynerus spinipes]
MVSESNQRFSNLKKDNVESLVKCADDKKESASKSKTGKKGSGKKITIEVDEDDPCLQGKGTKEKEKLLATPGVDPRFQQQNQTLRCYVMYTDFYRCENILGEGNDACTWFKRVFESICPHEWIRQWDELRVQGKFPWHKYKTQGDFPGNRYGDD